MRSWRATHNLLAVSANNMETAINTEQTLDTSLLVDMSTVVNLEPRREDNADELTGKEEADTIYHLGSLAGAPPGFSKAQAQHLAFIFAYALGAINTGAAGTGYEHTITPIDGDVDAYRGVPSFTAAMRLGKTVLKRRFASMFIDNFECIFARDDWVKITAQAKGTGKYTDNVYEETLSALDNAVALTLAANGVEGADAQTRLDNMQRIRAEYPSSDIWTEAVYSAVSSATPAVITITSLGGAGASVDYKLLYIPTESGWMTFPARVVETPLRVSEVTFKLGGKWDGSDFQGGRELDAEVNSIAWNFNNQLDITFGLGAGGAYANRCSRPRRIQTLKLDREFRDYIIQNHIAVNDDFGIEILAEGAVYDSPHKYQSRIIFPKVGVVDAPISISGHVVAEVGDLKVLQDDTYGSVITKTKNLQSTYAA